MTPAQRIPFADLAGQHAALAPELSAAFERVVGASAFILGEEVERFEGEFAAYCGTRHCVGVASGTAALTLALIAAGIGRGDEVIVPAHTFIASALAVVHAGATPVLCDVEDATGLIDPDAAEAAVGPRTSALLPVHLYGQTADMGAIGELARRRGLAVFEDAAQAHGALEGDRRAGSLSRAAGFSFYPSKNLGALGDAGAITTDDEELAVRARQLRDLGRRARDEHVLAGFNERLDGLQAAFLSVKLRHLDGWNEERRARSAEYRRALAGSPVGLLAERPRSTCVYHVFPVRSGRRDELQARLAAAGVATGIHYSPGLHGHPALAGAHRTSGSLARAEAWANEELSLPIFPSLRPAAIDRIAQICSTTQHHPIS